MRRNATYDFLRRTSANSSALWSGEVRVRLLDAHGQPLRAQPITRDVLAEEVRWEKSLAALRGKSARLELTVRNAALFAFEFDA